MGTSHKVVAVKENDTTLAVEEGSVDPQTQTDVYRQAGSPIQGAVAITQHRPQSTITIADIKAAQELFGLDGMMIDTDPVVLHTVLRADGAGLDTEGVSVAFDDGIVCPSTLQASQGEVATIEYMIYGGGAGGDTSPISISTSESAPDVTDAAQDQYTVGSVELGGSDLGPVQSIDIDFSPEIGYTEGDGEVYPEAVFIEVWEITGTIETEASDALDGPHEGDTGDLSITLNKREESGISDSDSLSISLPGECLTTLDSMSGDKSSSATTTLAFNAVNSDYSTFPVSIS